MIPFITSETALRSTLSELVFGINVFDLDLGVHVESVKQPIKRNTVGSGHVSRCRTSAFDNHLDYRFIVFENVRQGAKVRRFCVCGNVSHIEQLNIISVDAFHRLGVGVFPLLFVAQQVSMYW